MRRGTTIAALAAAALLAGCQTTYTNLANGQTISAVGATDNSDLAACRAEYQRIFAQYPSIHDGQIVPDCMRARGWLQQ
jgi:outer membrane protein assembly factor BamE (lipoprotein component of BamABCDE complex)